MLCSPASPCCSPFSVTSAPPPLSLPPVPPPSLADDCSTHSARTPGSDPGLRNSCSLSSGGQKNSCACSSKQTNPAPTGSSEFTRVAGPPEGPVGGQRDCCALADAPNVLMIIAIVTITASNVRTTIMRLMLSAPPPSYLCRAGLVRAALLCNDSIL